MKNDATGKFLEIITERHESATTEVMEPARANPVMLHASINIMVPSERDLFTMFIEKTNSLNSIIEENNRRIASLEGSLQLARNMLLKHTPKKYLTVKELSDLYGISESQQKSLRGRINNPLPYNQDGAGGKIRYKLSEVEEWMSQHKVQ